MADDAPRKDRSFALVLYVLLAAAAGAALTLYIVRTTMGDPTAERATPAPTPPATPDAAPPTPPPDAAPDRAPVAVDVATAPEDAAPAVDTRTPAMMVHPGDCAGTNEVFAWRCRAPVPGMSCTLVSRSGDGGVEVGAEADYLCSIAAVNVAWNTEGRVAGATCAQVTIPLARNNAWGNAFLCTREDSGYTVRVSYARPVDGMTCTDAWEPWTARRGAQNHLCYARTSGSAVGADTLDAGASP